MKLVAFIRRKTLILSFLLIFALISALTVTIVFGISVTRPQKEDFITYVEFNVPYSALQIALDADISLYEQEIPCPWYKILAVLASKYYGDFSRYRESDLHAIIYDLKNGKTIKDLAEGLELYSYYEEAYGAVLGGMVGPFDQQVERNGEIVWEQTYGLKAFSPIAQGFDYSHGDDFGAQRTWGYTRKHLGHDMMAETGTPVIAIETGVVECLGWNNYGGWRIGIRSLDGRRYYYYAHLRKGRPYAQGLKEGDLVTAGDVIGYVGRTGYSTQEDVNNIETSHLHLGMELIFDESQKECDQEIWIDLYPLTRLLVEHRSSVYRESETKEFYRKYNIREFS